MMKRKKKHSCFETSVVTKYQVFPLSFPIKLLDIKDMYIKKDEFPVLFMTYTIFFLNTA